MCGSIHTPAQVLHAAPQALGCALQQEQQLRPAGWVSACASLPLLRTASRRACSCWRALEGDMRACTRVFDGPCVKGRREAGAIGQADHSSFRGGGCIMRVACLDAVHQSTSPHHSSTVSRHCNGCRPGYSLLPPLQRMLARRAPSLVLLSALDLISAAFASSCGPGRSTPQQRTSQLNTAKPGAPTCQPAATARDRAAEEAHRSSMANAEPDALTFEIVSEEVKYARYLTVYDRVVRYTHRDGKKVGAASCTP